MNDPTAGMVRAYEIKVGDRIEVGGRILQVSYITPLGGDEMGPAVWKFMFCEPFEYDGDTLYFYGTLAFPYAALVKRI